MDGVRAMNTVVESPLEHALTDKELVKKYPEAAKLLRQVSILTTIIEHCTTTCIECQNTRMAFEYQTTKK